MIELCALDVCGNGDKVLRELQSKILNEFPDELIGVEMGVCYGGGIEALGKLWQGRGKVYGYDTFEGMPKGEAGYGSREANNLDAFYAQYGMEKLSYDYIRGELDEQGLYNVNLVKGLINQNSFNDLSEIHYCLIGLGYLRATEIGYNAIKDKIVPGGYLVIGGVCGRWPLASLVPWYQSVKNDPMWKVEYEGFKDMIAILRRVSPVEDEPVKKKKQRGFNPLT